MPKSEATPCGVSLSPVLAPWHDAVMEDSRPFAISTEIPSARGEADIQHLGAAHPLSDKGEIAAGSGQL